MEKIVVKVDVRKGNTDGESLKDRKNVSNEFQKRWEVAESNDIEESLLYQFSSWFGSFVEGRSYSKIDNIFTKLIIVNRKHSLHQFWHTL